MVVTTPVGTVAARNQSQYMWCKGSPTITQTDKLNYQHRVKVYSPLTANERLWFPLQYIKYYFIGVDIALSVTHDPVGQRSTRRHSIADAMGILLATLEECQCVRQQTGTLRMHTKLVLDY